MASGTLILRPCEDISIKHELKGDAVLPHAYLYISEEVADDDASYLYVLSKEVNVTVSHTSRFY